MDNSYDLVGEIPTALLLGWQRRPQGKDWTSIPEAGLNAGQYQLPETIPLAKTDKWTNRKAIKLSIITATPKVAVECRTKSQRVNG